MAKSKRERMKIASGRWASPTSFNALLGKPSTPSDQEKEPSILQISHEKRKTIPKNDIPISTIPKITIPINSIPKNNIPISAIPKLSTQQTLKPTTGYLTLPFHIIDTLFSSLLPSESSIFLRIFRLSRGFNRQTAETGYLTLCRNTCMTKNTAKAAILSLLSKGLISKKQLSANNTQYTLLADTSGPAFRVPNTVFDFLFPTLKPLQQIVYLYLYRHSLGEGRSFTSPIGYTSLSKSLNSCVNTLVQALHSLEETKHITFDTRSQQGSIYRLSTDAIPNSDIPKAGVLKNGIAENGPVVYQNPIHSVSNFDRPSILTIKNNTTTTEGVSLNGIPKNDIPKLDTPNKEMLLLLISNGISEKASYALISQYGIQRCQKGVDYALSFSKRKEVINLPGLITQAIQGDYTTAEELRDRRKQEQSIISQQQKEERVRNILSKLQEGLFITQREYHLLPDYEQEKLKYDEDHFRQKNEWRYSAAEKVPG